MPDLGEVPSVLGSRIPRACPRSIPTPSPPGLPGPPAPLPLPDLAAFPADPGPQPLRPPRRTAPDATWGHPPQGCPGPGGGRARVAGPERVSLGPIVLPQVPSPAPGRAWSRPSGDPCPLPWPRREGLSRMVMPRPGDSRGYRDGGTEWSLGTVTSQLPGDQRHRNNDGAPLVTLATQPRPGAFPQHFLLHDAHPFILLPLLLQLSRHPSPLSCQEWGWYTHFTMAETSPASPSVLPAHPQGLPETRAQPMSGNQGASEQGSFLEEPDRGRSTRVCAFGIGTMKAGEASEARTHTHFFCS